MDAIKTEKLTKHYSKGFWRPRPYAALEDLNLEVGQGEVFGDGVRCAGGQLVRLGTATNSAAGSSQYPSGAQLPVSARGGVTSVGTRTYQAWYRNVAPFCTPAPFNTTNGWEIFWGA